MSEPSICPDCGRNTEFILHEDACPQFGKEVEEFLAKHDAEIATWPPAARQQLEYLNAMQAHLFGKNLRLRMIGADMSMCLSLYRRGVGDPALSEIALRRWKEFLEI